MLICSIYFNFSVDIRLFPVWFISKNICKKCLYDAIKMLYTVFLTQIMFSVDSLDPGHCPRTSILDFFKIGQMLFSPCSLHIYIADHENK